MSHIFYKIIAYILPTVEANAGTGIGNYVPLTPDSQLIFGNPNVSFSNFMNGMYVTIITIAIVASVGLFIYHSFRYSLSDLLPTKKSAKEALYNIILGLGLILCAYLILYSINPAIVSLDFGGYSSALQPPDPSKTTFQSCNSMRSTMKGDHMDLPGGEGVYVKRIYSCLSLGSDYRAQDRNYTTFERVESFEALVAVRTQELLQQRITPTMSDSDVQRITREVSQQALETTKSSICEAKLSEADEHSPRKNCAYIGRRYYFSGAIVVDVKDIDLKSLVESSGAGGSIFDGSWDTSSPDRENRYIGGWGSWKWQGQRSESTLEVYDRNIGISKAACDNFINWLNEPSKRDDREGLAVVLLGINQGKSFLPKDIRRVRSDSTDWLGLSTNSYGLYKLAKSAGKISVTYNSQQCIEVTTPFVINPN